MNSKNPLRRTLDNQRAMLSRRDFIQLAIAMGASFAWGGAARASQTSWKERRDLLLTR
jgi:hypothetical protein